jgi:hypothetical protein
VLGGFIAVVVLLVVRAGRRRRAQLMADAGPPIAWPPGGGPQPVHHPLGAQAWTQAGPGLAACGLRQLDAENYTLKLPGILSMLIVTLRPTVPEIRGLIDHECDGGMFQMFLGKGTTLRPGEAGNNEFGKLLASYVGKLMSTLPPGASLEVAAPQLPGDKYKASLHTPFGAVEHPVVVARVLLLLDELSRMPPAPGMRMQLPPVALAWREAGASLAALGLKQLDPETYIREHGSRSFETLYLRLKVPIESVHGSLDRHCPGGMLEAFLGKGGSLRPGAAGTTPVEQFLASQVGELMSRLPPDAVLEVRAPDVPGDVYKAWLSSRFASAEVPALVARVLLTLDQAARAPMPRGMQVQLPRVAVCWQQAAPLLSQLGLRQLDAEVFIREMGGLRETLYVRLHAGNESVSASLDRTRPGGMLDRFLGARAELAPGQPGGSPLAAFVASQMGELLGQLPPGSLLSIKAPDIPGDGYELRVTSPLQHPQHAASAARLVLALDQVVQRTS